MGYYIKNYVAVKESDREEVLKILFDNKELRMEQTLIETKNKQGYQKDITVFEFEELKTWFTDELEKTLRNTEKEFKMLQIGEEETDIEYINEGLDKEEFYFWVNREPAWCKEENDD